MSFLSRLLSSLLQISLDDDQPASCLQPVLAWKERVVEHQELSVSSLNMLAIETCQKEQEELGEHNRVDLQENSLQQQQKQDKPDKLVEGGQGGAYRPQPTAQRGKGEHQLPNSRQRACKAKREELGQACRAKREELGQRGKEGRRKQQEKGEAYSDTVPSLEPTKARGSASFPTARAELAETSSNQKEARASLHGATTAGRQGTPPKLACPPVPSNKNTNRRTLCPARAERNSFKETMETNLLLSDWLPTKVS